ncbi:MAG: cyclic nucleotide-binding domain-containing protein [Spirochaetales bacterium]|nr:cyclic nucleotide-binding domain-containing protein [Spirochaetales bacterium]
MIETRKYKKGDLICTEGAPGDEMYLVLSGKVSVYKTQNCQKISLTTLGKNDFFGEMRLLLGLPRTASVEAQEATEIMIIPRKNFLAKLKDDPRFAGRMLQVLARRLVDAHEVIKNLEGEKASLEIIYKSRSSV